MWNAILEYKIYFFVAFGLIIPTLGYAVYLQLKTYKDLQNEKEKVAEDAKEKFFERQESLRESLEIIALATLQGQCEPSEACLRIANLLPHYSLIDQTHTDYEPLFSFFNEIKELKTHQERNDMKISLRHEEDKIRYAAEEKYKISFLEICKLVHKNTSEASSKFKGEPSGNS